jgi:prepilin-type N-terminal cleavage/methylation domain-containing protein
VNSKSQALRSGVTLIEVLVVIGIIAIVMGIAIPAILMTRSSGDRLACQNNLRQVLLGLQNYHSAHGMFPPGAGLPARASPLVMILPFVEQDDRFKQFDLTKDVNVDPGQNPAKAGDVAIYLCPSDSSPGGRLVNRNRPEFLGRCNYLGNHGTSAKFANNDLATAGVFDFNEKNQGVRLTEITDGASNTALYSEIKRGNPQDEGPNPLDITWIVFRDQWASDMEPFPECGNFEDHSVFKYAGCQFFRGFFISGLYTHTSVPNYTGRDCVYIDADGKTAEDRGHQAARSYHKAGVNAGFADGSMRFIGDSISLATWKALGTRAAGDLVGGDM